MPPSGADYSLNAESSIRYLFSVSASAFIAWLTGRELTCDSFVRNLWQWGSSQHTVNANELCTKALLGLCWFRICITYGADYTEADYLSVTNKVTNTHWSLYTSTEAVITDTWWWFRLCLNTILHEGRILRIPKIRSDRLLFYSLQKPLKRFTWPLFLSGMCIGPVRNYIYALYSANTHCAA